MVKFKYLANIIMVFAFVGCGVPEPVELDGDSHITINQELLRKEKRNIPLDPFLKENNWTYNLVFEKNGNDYIPNDMIVKTFYVAHHADRIIIIGNKEIAQDYKEYLIKNDCKNIAIHPVNNTGNSKKRVNILFFGMKGENDESFIKNFTNLFNFE